MMLNTNSTQEMESKLNEYGARDVKFCFNPEMVSMELSEAKEMLADVLMSYLDTEKKPFSGIGDNKSW